MKGYKGFDKDWKCRDMQYEVGKTYEEAEARLCNKGLHFCENPFDVFNYYSPSNQSRYAVVEAENVTDEKDSDTKRVAKKLTIKTELNLIGIVKAGMEYIKEHINVEKIKEKAFDSSTAATSGYRSTAATSGNESTAATSGDRSTAATSGNESTAATSGDRSTAATSGNESTAATSGNESTAATSGYRSTAATSGNESTAATSGDRSTAATSGNESTAATSGNESTAATSGDSSTAATSGNESTAATSGNESTAATSGDRSTAIVEGKDSVAIALGAQSKAKGALGCWLVLAEWEETNDDVYRKDVKCFRVDGEIIKADTFYKLENGEAVLVDSGDENE